MTAVGGSLNTESISALFNGVPGQVSFSVFVLGVIEWEYILL